MASKRKLSDTWLDDEIVAKPAKEQRTDIPTSKEDDVTHCDVRDDTVQRCSCSIPSVSTTDKSSIDDDPQASTSKACVPQSPEDDNVVDTSRQMANGQEGNVINLPEAHNSFNALLEHEIMMMVLEDDEDTLSATDTCELENHFEWERQNTGFTNQHLNDVLLNDAMNVPFVDTNSDPFIEGVNNVEPFQQITDVTYYVPDNETDDIFPRINRDGTVHTCHDCVLTFTSYCEFHSHMERHHESNSSTTSKQ